MLERQDNMKGTNHGRGRATAGAGEGQNPQNGQRFPLPRERNGLSKEDAKLYGLLHMADERFPAPVWGQLMEAILQEGTPSEPEPIPPSTAVQPEPGPNEACGRPWYEQDQLRVALEKAVLTKQMTACADVPGLFFILRRTRQLGAAGLVAIGSGVKVRLDLIFPTDYPQSLPRAFIHGGRLERLAHRLRPDGSVPVAMGEDQRWDPTLNSGFVVCWAIEWLLKVAEVTPLGATRSNGQQLRGESWYNLN